MNREIKFEWSLTGDGDRYGDTMEWAFGCAYALTVLGEDIPEHWQFRPGDDAHDDAVVREHSYTASVLLDLVEEGLATADDIRHAGSVFIRYADILRANSEGY